MKEIQGKRDEENKVKKEKLIKKKIQSKDGL